MKKKNKSRNPPPPHQKYNPENYDKWGQPGFEISRKERIECRVALQILRRGVPVTLPELDELLRKAAEEEDKIQ